MLPNVSVYIIFYFPEKVNPLQYVRFDERYGQNEEFKKNMCCLIIIPEKYEGKNRGGWKSSLPFKLSQQSLDYNDARALASFLKNASGFAGNLFNKSFVSDLLFQKNGAN